MALDGAHADPQAIGGFLARQPGLDQADDIVLASGQLIQSRAGGKRDRGAGYARAHQGMDQGAQLADIDRLPQVRQSGAVDLGQPFGQNVPGDHEPGQTVGPDAVAQAHDRINSGQLSGQILVGDHQSRATNALLDQRHRRFAILSGDHLVAVEIEQRLQSAPDRVVVLDQQDRGAGRPGAGAVRAAMVGQHGRTAEKG